MKLKNLLLTIAGSLIPCSFLFAQDLPVVVQAESGTLGSDFNKLDTVGITCVTIKTDVVNTGNPGNDNRVITYQVTFTDSGTYDLYMHILVGKNTYNDDSYFYANGFGIKNSSLTSDWITANNLDPVGYTIANQVVDGAGGAQNLVWKWLDVSKFNGGATPISFKVDKSALTQTFEIGARENGLYIDKFVFGRKGLYFTVSNLDKGEAGSKYAPGQQPLGKPLAAGKSKFLGNVYDNTQAPRFAGFWNQVTPGNAGKWGSVEGTRGSFYWADLDTAYKFAKKNHFPFKEHNLIWGANSNQPGWKHLIL